MIFKRRIFKSILAVILIILVSSIVSTAFSGLTLKNNVVNASTTSSPGWYYSGWEYRQANDLTNSQTQQNFFGVSAPSAAISGNPTQQHSFQPVHSNTMTEVDTRLDGNNTWKYLAYDSDPNGTMINLYYSNNTAGPWTPYSLNPILGPKADNFRWPSTTYVNGVFNMFLENVTGGSIERWTSTNGTYFTFAQDIRTGGNAWGNPFIWFNPNDGNWYLYTHNSWGSTEAVEVRSANSISGLASASDSIVVSRTTSFGSPTVMFYGGVYWLMAEIQVGSRWQIVTYFSTTSPTSGFVEAANSPTITDDEACPMLFLTPTQTQAYLFTNGNSATWNVNMREVYLTSSTAPQSSDLSNYQISINVNFGNGTSSGNNVYLNCHSQQDFSDVRFTWFNASSNSEVECPYWIEQATPGVNATFWVKIPLIPASGSSTMYIYYGKNNCTTTSNGNATFEFFDDFSGNLSKWTAVGGSWQIQNGMLVAQTTAYGQRLRANNLVFADDSVHATAQWVSGTYFENGPLVRGQSPNEQNNGYMTVLSTATSDSSDRIDMVSNTVKTTLAGQGQTAPSQNVSYSFVFSTYGNTLRSSISPLYPTVIASVDNTFSSGSFCLFSWANSAETVHYNNVFVTKYSYPQPTQGNWHGEEIGPLVMVDKSCASGSRVNVGSTQTVAFHVQWANGSSITAGSVYINGSQCEVNTTGWANLPVSSSLPSNVYWVVTGVNCNGITAFRLLANAPCIIWDQIGINSGGVTKASTNLWRKCNSLV